MPQVGIDMLQHSRHSRSYSRCPTFAVVVGNAACTGRQSRSLGNRRTHDTALEPLGLGAEPVVAVLQLALEHVVARGVLLLLAADGPHRRVGLRAEGTLAIRPVRAR